MALMKYDPFEFADVPTGLRVFQDTMNRLLEPSTPRPWAPPVDIFETDNELVLKADVPDVELKDIDIQLENGTLAIKGERKYDREGYQKKDGGYHRIERSYGSFARYFTLPDTVDFDKVAADYKNGVLTVTLPKKEVAKPKQIKVAVKSN
ncbi:MAG TPA: Hsp20/alpha crystallin family protein [Bryobacteraceae bacterium]|nr:Hsp20/alpha crystallin family protein [Bryobacteraceae bacterium]